jgi:SAM-dependent methyltransferase
VLDVGCGAGALARELALRVERVDAVDRDPAMVVLAGARAPVNLTVLVADALTVDLPAGGYDAVLSLSSLHHLPLQPALERMAGWLRPGGVLAAVVPPRIDLPAEIPVELAAVIGHRALGLAFAAGRAASGRSLFARPPDSGAMPVQDPELTTRRLRAAASAVLPGVQVRRLVFWRCLLTWTKPSA